MTLKPCPYRHADDDGLILCNQIKTGDREVSPNLCRVCPIANINCAHLRATLAHHVRPPITVRWGNGKTEVWDDLADNALSLARAACAAKVTPIASARDCAGCALRVPLVTAAPPTAAQPIAAPRLHATPSAPPAPAPDARTSVVAQKIIQLQEWLAKNANRTPRDDADEDAPAAVAAHTARPAHTAEEKRVGWTD